MMLDFIAKIQSILINALASLLKWLWRPLSSSFDEYRLIRRIWASKYPEPGNQLPLSPLERSVMTLLIAIRSLSLVHLCKLATHYRIASFISEFYVILRFAILTLVFMIHSYIPEWLCYSLAIYCLIDGINYRLCIIFVDRYGKSWGLRSLNRSLMLLLINYCELIVGFALLYLVSAAVGFSESSPISTHLEAMYFSIVTITTLGYGDIKPINSLGRWLCLLEVLVLCR